MPEAELQDKGVYEQVLDWWHAEIVQSEALYTMLDAWKIPYAYHSTAMENRQIRMQDVQEIFTRGSVTNFTGEIRTMWEIAGAKNAHDLLLQSLQGDKPLTRDLVKSFHWQLTEHTYAKPFYDVGERPGLYKRHSYVVGKHEIGSSAADVPEEMDELITDLVSIQKPHVLIAAAYYHCRFENIRPFADGNGPCGRLALNYYLLRGEHPPVIIFLEDQAAYYEALEAWDLQEATLPMELFLGDQTVKTWKTLMPDLFN